MTPGWFLPLHVALGAGHQWFYQAAAIVFIGGLWLAAAGVAERRQAQRGGRHDPPS